MQATIAARQPFLDFSFGRVNADGSKQRFRVSGEPMFNQSCRFIGYRGIGVEVSDISVSVNGDRASAKFRQGYTSDNLSVTSRKTLDLVKSGNRWLIVRESTGS